jgi:hypothetical protein
MRAAGLDEQLIYAWEEKTGFILTEESPHTEEEIAEWNAAIEEYRTKQCH